MMFIKNVSCHAQHRSKVIHHYNKVLIVHYSCYHGYRKKEQPNSSIPRDSNPSRLCRGVQLYPHGEMGWTSISHVLEIKVASCLQPFPNLARVSDERFDWLLDQCLRHSWPTPTPSPVSRINRSWFVTWLVAPICDMWSIRMVTQTYASQ